MISKKKKFHQNLRPIIFSHIDFSDQSVSTSFEPTIPVELVTLKIKSTPEI
jgi:hypothetical protein